MKVNLLGLRVVFQCACDNDEWIRVDAHEEGALIEMFSPSHTAMDENGQVVLNDLDISNMINTLKHIQKERGIKL